MKRYIGIDPGSKGFICVMTPEGEPADFFSIADHDLREIALFLREASEGNDGNVFAIMEEVHSVFGSSTKSTFNFGKINGYLLGVLETLRIPYALVQPKDWQKEIWINNDRVKGPNGKIDTKKTSLNAGKRLFPDVDFRKTERCTNLDDNKCDATLLATYGMRKNY